MKNKKLLLMASALVLGVGTLASCGGPKNPSSEAPAPGSSDSTSGDSTSSATRPDGKGIVVWCAKEDVPFVEEMAAKFKEANTEYKDYYIKVDITSEADAATLVKSDPAASADVFHFAGDQLGTLVRQEVLYGINPKYIKDLGIEQSVLDAGKVGEVNYGIPFTPNTYFMYYDASVYTEDDIKSLDTMVAKDVSSKNYTYNFGLDICNGWYLQSYFFSAGCTIFGEDGLDGTAGIQPRDKGLEVAKWVWDYYNGANKSKLYAGDGSALCGKSIAACVTGTWNASMIKENIEANGGTYAAAPLPKLTIGGQEYDWKAVGDFKQIGINSITAEPVLSCKFASFLAGKDSQARRYELRKTAPTNAATAADTSIEWDKAILAQTAQLTKTFSQPTIYAERGFWNASTALGDDLKTASVDDIEVYFDAFLNTITAAAE